MWCGSACCWWGSSRHAAFTRSAGLRFGVTQPFLTNLDMTAPRVGHTPDRLHLCTADAMCWCWHGQHRRVTLPQIHLRTLQQRCAVQHDTRVSWGQPSRQNQTLSHTVLSEHTAPNSHLPPPHGVCSLLHKLHHAANCTCNPGTPSACVAQNRLRHKCLRCATVDAQRSC